MWIVLIWLKTRSSGWLVKTVVTFRFHKRAGDFLTSWRRTRISRQILLYWVGFQGSDFLKFVSLKLRSHIGGKRNLSETDVSSVTYGHKDHGWRRRTIESRVITRGRLTETTRSTRMSQHILLSGWQMDAIAVWKWNEMDLSILLVVQS